MQLRDAVTKLNDADKAVRDTAMGTVLQAREGAIGPLVDALGSPGAPVAKIALLLAALKARQGIGKLVDLLNKGVLDVDTRAVVARAFGELVDGRDAFEDKVRRAVLNLSKDGHTTTRQLTVKALHAIGDGDSEARLKEMAAADPDLNTRKAALDAVKLMRALRAEGEAALAALNGGGSSRGGAMEEGGLALDLEALARQQAAASGPVLAPMRPPEVDAPSGPHAHLVRKLRDPRWAMRGPAVDEVVALASGAERAEVIATLVDVLAGAQVSAKIGAAQALARMQAPEAARALLDVVTTSVPASADDELKQLRAIGLKALACSLTGAEEGFAQPLLPLVRDVDPFVRAGALLCLGRLADRVGARAATVALSDPHDHVVEAAAVALSEGTREEDRDLVLPLLAVLGGMPSPTVAVREAILLALSRINVDPASSPDAAAILLRLRHRVRPSVLGMTSSLRRTAIAVLERCYSVDDPAPVGIVDDVLGRLADEHPEVRLLAASFLAQHMEPGITGAVERIEDALDREERPVSLLSLEALRKHDTAKAKQALEACAEDPDEAIAARAKELLAGFAPQTQEWAPPEGAPASAEEHVDKGAPAPHATTEEGPPLEMPTVPEPPRRSRVRAVSGGDGADVVEAKDGVASEKASLKERLAAVKSAGNDANARAAVIESFIASVPPPRRSLKDELGALGGLNEDEKRARREAILSRF